MARRNSVAGKLLDRSHADLIEVKVDDLFAAQAVAEDIQARLGPDYEAQDWADMNKSLFSALWLEKMAMSITIGLIVRRQDARAVGPETGPDS